MKHKPVASEESAAVSTETRNEEYSSGSLAGSIASGSSGFGSLTKKRTALLSSGKIHRKILFRKILDFCRLGHRPYFSGGKRTCGGVDGGNRYLTVTS